MLKTNFNANPITLLKTGNIRFSEPSLVLGNAFDRVELEFDGLNWVVLSFRSNA